MGGMNSLLIALFVSASAQGLPAGQAEVCFADAPCAPVRVLAGKARQLDAVVAGDAPANGLQSAVHIRGAHKPAFDPSAKRPIV
jgi:hypothetical protein